MNAEMDAEPGTGETSGSHAGGQHAEPVAAVDVNTILRGRRAVHLRLGEQTYKLSVTSAGKLILTK